MLTCYIRFFFTSGSLLEIKSLLAYYFILRCYLFRRFFSLTLCVLSICGCLPFFAFAYLSVFSFAT